ncbi:MAG: membrane protein insertase YidC [Pseudomonadota bacterium]
MDQKNLILAIVLSVVIILGFNFFLVPDSPLPTATQQSETQSGDARDGIQPRISQEEVSTPAAEPLTREEVLAQDPRIAIDTDRLSGSIDLRGARMDDLILKDYHVELSKESPNVELLAPRGAAHPYFATLRWLTSDDIPVPDRDTIWQATPDTLTVDTPVTLHWENGQGQRFEIDIAVDNNYLFTLTQRVINRGNQSVRVQPYGLVNRVGIPPTLDTAFIVHEGLVGVLDETYEEVDYDDVADAPRGIIEQRSTGGWMGFFDKYWTVLLIPQQDQVVDARFTNRRSGAEDVYQTDMAYDPVDVPPGVMEEHSFRLYAGAREPNLIDRYNDEYGIDKFYLAVDYGWIFFLARPIYLALNWFHGLVGNFGVAILLLVVCVRILLFPLANKAYKSMAKMRKLQPRMLELRERYKEDKPRFQKEMMGLYKKEGANPVAGCLPMLLQIPIFIALYNVLYGTILMRHAPFFGWIQDLSAPDPTSWMNLFGLLPYEIPNLGLLGFFSLGIWPLLMGISMWAQYKLNPQPTDPLQAKIFAWMPVVFTFMLGHFAAGLVIYWAWNNLLSMGQQVIIMRRQGIPIGGKMPPITLGPLGGSHDQDKKPELESKPEPEPEDEPEPAKPAEEKTSSRRRTPSKSGRRRSNPAAKKRRRN